MSFQIDFIPKICHSKYLQTQRARKLATRGAYIYKSNEIETLKHFLPHCVEIAGWPLNNSHVPKQYVKGAAVHIADGDCGLANCAAATKASQAAEASQATKDPT